MLASGERLPLPIDKNTGTPLYKPTLFMLSELRQRNRATDTILRNLRELTVLFDFLAEHNIKLEDRMEAGELLSLWEIDALTRRCREHVEKTDRIKSDVTPKKSNVLHLEKARMRRVKTAPKIVSSQTAANRILTIHRYLEWLTSNYLSGGAGSTENKTHLHSAATDVLQSLQHRIPNPKARNTLGQREGLPQNTLERILAVIDPASPENPWRDRFARSRNILIIYLLRTLGIRRGELLNIKISDIDFQQNVISILRRPDDQADPRTFQPRVKTRERILALPEPLVAAIEHHILHERAQIPGSEKTAFLFLTERSRQPMSLSSLNKLFRVLRTKVPDLPNSLSPHVLRHDWNDEFSKKMDANKVSNEEEHKFRSYLMGWSPTSGTAALYTRRHVRNKAMAVSLEMQAKNPRSQGNTK